MTVDPADTRGLGGRLAALTRAEVNSCVVMRDLSRHHHLKSEKEEMSPMVVKTWAKMGRYVDHESGRPHEPDYYATARRVAKRCVAWRNRNVPEARVTWVENAL